MKWFKHFTKAHRDTKIKKLINEFGADSYAVYFYCLELIADTIESDNITFELEDDAQLVGQFLKIDTLRVESIMKRCVELELFGVSSAGRVTCIKMAKFLDERFTRNPQLKSMIKSDKMIEVKGLLSSDNHQTIRDIPPQIRLDQIRLDQNRIDIDLKEVIELYPTRCENRKVSLKRSVYNKDKLIKIIKEKGIEQVKEIIKLEVNENKDKYLKDFKTFINNFPDISDYHKGSLKENIRDVPRPAPDRVVMTDDDGHDIRRCHKTQKEYKIINGVRIELN